MPWVLILLLVGGYLYMSRGGPPPAGWGEDYQAARAAASESRQPLVVAFHGRACPPCWSMDRGVLGDEKVLAALEGFVPVRVYAGSEPELAKSYELFGTPTYLIIAPDGTLLRSCAGAQSVDEFVAFLQEEAPTPSGG